MLQLRTSTGLIKPARFAPSFLANERIDALDDKIEELERVRASLRRFVRERSSGSEGACPISTAFDHIDQLDA